MWCPPSDCDVIICYHGVRKKDGGRTVRLLPAYFWLGRVVFARRRWRRISMVSDALPAAGIGCAQHRVALTWKLITSTSTHDYTL